MSLNFHTITAEECLLIEPVVSNNAHSLYASAQVLAEAGKYGPAVSLLILGSEERLKAVFLLLEGKGFALRGRRGFHKLFSSHRSRHTIFKTFFTVWLAIAPLFDNIIAMTRKRLHRKGLLAKLITSLPASLLRSYLNYNWWEKADKLKQQGFYVDYDDNIITPVSITKEQFNIAQRHVRELEESVNRLAIFITSLDANGLEELKLTLRGSAIFELMEESL